MDQNELITKITQEVMKRLQAEMSKQGVQLVGAAGGKFTGADPASLAKYIDHTILKPDATKDQIITLCKEALEYKFASVCVNPCWIKTCSEMLSGSDVMVCSVIGFPLGTNTTCLKVEEAKRAVADGAQEIDMVINIGKLKSKGGKK